MSSPSLKPVAFVNSDILIKAFIDKCGGALAKLQIHAETLFTENGEKFFISEYVLNDVIAKAYEKGISKDKILEIILPENTVYFQLIPIPGQALADALLLLHGAPDGIKLTLTEWTALILMLQLGIKKIISDNVELDKVIKNPDFNSIFKDQIERV